MILCDLCGQKPKKTRRYRLGNPENQGKGRPKKHPNRNPTPRTSPRELPKSCQPGDNTDLDTKHPIPALAPPPPPAFAYESHRSTEM